jgi:hypothetical protein
MYCKVRHGLLYQMPKESLVQNKVTWSGASQGLECKAIEGREASSGFLFLE